MKISRIYLIIFLCTILINCSEDETPSPEIDSEEQPKPGEPTDPVAEVYFTYTANNVDTENWIIIHDAEGKLLDYQKAESGQQIEFIKIKDSIPEIISITEFVYTDEDVFGKKNHALTTYTNIESGGSWNKVDDFSQGNKIGAFNVVVDSIPGLRTSSISTMKGTVDVELKTINQQSSVISGPNASIEYEGISLYENRNYLISIYDKAAGHKYLKIENPEENAQLSFKYSEFQDYDKYLEVDLPPNNYALFRTWGFQEANPNYFIPGRIFSFYTRFNYAGMFKAGYLENYEKYRTDFHITLEGYSYGISKTGNFIEEISIPSKPSHFVEKTSIYDFEFTSELTHVRKSTHHTYDGGDNNITTGWTVHSSSQNHHEVGQLPEEIIGMYPSFNLSNLEILTLNIITRGQTAQEFFEQQVMKVLKDEIITEAFAFTKYNGLNF